MSLVPATLDLSLPTATPSAPVGSLGWVRVFPLPLAVRVTTAPGTGAPAASRTVTRMVATPLPTSIEDGSAETVEVPALGTVPAPLPPPPPLPPEPLSSPPAFSAIAVKVTGSIPLTTALTLLGPSDPSVQVAEAVPFSSVVGLWGTTVPPPVVTTQATR